MIIIGHMIIGINITNNLEIQKDMSTCITGKCSVMTNYVRIDKIDSKYSMLQ